MDNNQFLIELNSTLKPDPGSGKIGIFLPGQNGDLMTAASVLKYRQELWPGKEIVWFCNSPNADALRFGPVSEVRPWLWAGNGLPEGTPDFYPLLCRDNRLTKLALEYELTKDLEDGYFPAPWMVTDRAGVDYADCAKRVFQVDSSKPWHPYLCFSKEERDHAEAFFNALPRRKTIMLETFCGSSQSIWDDDITTLTIKTCKEIWGDCNLIFASHTDNSKFCTEEGIVSASHFTVRQTALINDYCNLFIGISSGISVATSCWGSAPVPKLQFCGSKICSTVNLANGPIELVTHDEKLPALALSDYLNRLNRVLIQYK